MSWTNQQLAMIWQKGIPDAKYDSAMYRMDRFGSWMEWGAYGNRKHDFGWEVDHRYPESKGGSDDLSNVQPLHWKNNVAKSDSIIY